MQNILEDRVTQAVRGVPAPVAEVVAETLEAARGAGIDSAQTVVLVRGIRALIKLIGETKAQMAGIAFASTDLEAFVSLLQEPTVQALLSECDPFAKAKIRGLAAQSKLLAAEGGCISSHEAAELIGLSPQSVDKARKKGKLLPFPVDRIATLIHVGSLSKDTPCEVSRKFCKLWERRHHGRRQPLFWERTLD